MDDRGVTFRWTDYHARAKVTGNGWIKAMTLPADEFVHLDRSNLRTNCSSMFIAEAAQAKTEVPPPAAWLLGMP